MAIEEIVHLSIFINANQQSRQAVNQIGWILNSLISLVPQYSFS